MLETKRSGSVSQRKCEKLCAKPYQRSSASYLSGSAVKTFDNDSNIVRTPKAMLTRIAISRAVIPLFGFLNGREFQNGSALDTLAFNYFVATVESIYFDWPACQ